MKVIQTFNVLECVDKAELYYIDNQFGLTDNILTAERYSSPDEAVRYMNPDSWKVRTVLVGVEE